MATMDTHCVEGYTCELCEDEYENPYYNVISCSDRQLSAFVDWIKEQPFAENTTVVLCGDHLTMDAAYSDSVDEDFHRTDFNVIINAAICESQGTEAVADQIKNTNNYYNKHFRSGKNKA